MRGVIEWFWRGAKLARARTELDEFTERAGTFVQRARAGAELAQSIVTPSEPGEVRPEATACDLYRQSVYWSLCALAARVGADPGTTYDAAIWDSLATPLLVKAASEERSLGLRDALTQGSFVQFAELPDSEQLTLCGELRKLALELLGKVEQREKLLGAIYQERLFRLGALGALCLAVWAGAHQAAAEREKRRDLTYDRPWRASSQLQTEGKCASPAQECAQASGFFFHTNEDTNPWLEFDLGAEKSFTRVEVTNRTNCCSERAVPLAVEVSLDHHTWREVARKESDFAQWTATVTPVTAHWVRLRVLSRNYLHLARVAIY